MARPNPEAERKAKEKKQKIIAAVGGVLLLALLGIQGPKVMSKLHQKPPPLPGNVLPPNGNPVGQTTPSLAAPTLAGQNGGSAGGGGGASATKNPASGNGPASALAVFEVAPDPDNGQLRSFSRFVSKDPFQQQIAVDESGNPLEGGGSSGSSDSSSSGSSSSGSSSSGSAGSGSSGSGSFGSTGSGSSGAGSSGSGSGSGSTSRPVTSVSAVKISINDAPALTVSVGSDFPADKPLFHLVAATTAWAKVSIAGGSYADGRSTVKLRVGHPVTLENTADRTRYKLALLGTG